MLAGAVENMVMVIGALVEVEGVLQGAFEIITQVIDAEPGKDEDEKLGLFVPTLEPFTFH